MSLHWGVRALLRGGVSRSGEEEGLRRPGEAAPHTGMGECRGHRGDAQGVQDKQGGQESRAE